MDDFPAGPTSPGPRRPPLSVVIPVRNGGHDFERCLRGLRASSWTDFELVVVDDGSTDGTAERLARLTDPRIRLIRRSHEGRVAALNHAIGLARGRYLANLDADDVALPGRLALPARFLDEHPDVAVVGSAIQPFIGEEATRRPRRLPRSDLAIRWSFLLRNPIFNSSATFRAASVVEAGGYDPGHDDVMDDADLLLRLGQRHRLANLEAPLAAKRLHRGQHFAAVDRRRRLLRHASCRFRAAHELRFPRLLRPVAHAVAGLGAARSVVVIGLAGRNGGLRRGPARATSRHRLKART